MKDAETGAVAGARRRRRRHLWWAVPLFLLLVLLVGGVFALSGRPLHAPDWVRERVAERVAQAAPGLDLDFGELSLIARPGAPLRVRLGNVELRDDQGVTVAELAVLEAGLSPLAALRGQPVLQGARAAGAMMRVERTPDGTLRMALGGGFEDDRQMPAVGEVLAQIDMALSDPRLAELRAITVEGVTVRYEDARARRGWTADGGLMRLTREDGQLRLAGNISVVGSGAQAARLEVNAESAIGSRAVSFGVTLHDLPAQDIATQSPALAWLNALRAPISGALRTRMREDGTLGTLNATLQIGEGALQPTLNTRALPFDSARTYLTYDPDEGVLRFDEIAVRSPLGEVSASGDAVLAGIEDGWPDAIEAQMRVSRVALAEGAALERAVTLEGADVAFKLALDPFRVRLGELHVTDPALPVRLSGRFSAEPSGWALGVDAQLAQTTPQEVLTWWPRTFRRQLRNWVRDNLLEGQLTDAAFALRSTAGEEPDIHLDAEFEGLQLRYSPDLADITGGNGRIAIHDSRLGVWLDEGTADPGRGGVLSLAGSRFTIDRLGQEPMTGKLDLVAEGSAEAALAYIDNPAWRVLSRTGRDPGLATGQVELAGTLSLPLIRNIPRDEVVMDFEGVLRDVESDSLVPGKTLTADRLTLRLDSDRVEVEGGVELSGLPATGRWTQPIRGGAPGEVRAQVELSPGALADFGILLPPDMLSGRGTGDLALDFRESGPPDFRLTSALDGLGVEIAPLGWRLTQGQSGRFEIAGRLGSPVRIDGLSLSGAGLSAEGGLSLNGSGGFGALRLDRLTLGNWLDVEGVLTARGPGQIPAIELSGGRVDMRGLPAGSGGAGGGGSPVPLTLALDRLEVTDRIWVEDMRGRFSLGSALVGSFEGVLGGEEEIVGETSAAPGGTALRVYAEDAGDAVDGAGLPFRLENGPLELWLVPVPGVQGTYDGQLAIRQTRLRGMSAVAALLDAISLVGILDQLNGPGIFFSDVDARFRLSPQQIVLQEGTAVGPSMGVSLDGYINLAQQRVDLQGVLSPIYILNGIGQLVSRRGEGLIGFNFNLRGPFSGPQVSVNPLSALTPGIFRDIFRRPRPEVSQ